MVSFLLSLHLNLFVVGGRCVFEGRLDKDSLVQLKMLISLLVFS